MEGVRSQDVYRCYDESLRDYLYKNGIKYILTAFDIKTKVQFWAFYRSAEFEKHLEEWIKNNPKYNFWEE